jgi:hypothetical protein
MVAPAIVPGGSTTGRKDSRDLGSGLSSRPRRQSKNISQQRQPKSRAASISRRSKFPHSLRPGRNCSAIRPIAIRQPCRAGASILKHLVKLDNVRLDRIDVAAVERVRDELRANLGAKTISAVLTPCAALFKLAQRRSWAANNPRQSRSGRAGRSPN